MVQSKRAIAFILALGGLSAAYLASAVQAGAEVRDFKARSTTRCIDDSPQFGLREFFPCHGLTFQQWSVARVGTRFTLSPKYTIQNQNTYRCLDDSFELDLRAIPCNGRDYQQWYVTNYGGLANRYVTLKNVRTGRCVDDSFEYRLRSHTCNGQFYQQWVTRFD